MDASQKSEDKFNAKDLVLVSAVTLAATYGAVKAMAWIGDAVIDTFTLAKTKKTSKK